MQLRSFHPQDLLSGSWPGRLAAIKHARERFQPLTLSALKDESLKLQYSAKCGQNLNKLLPAAFGLLSEVSHRIHGMLPYDVQLMGAMRLCRRNIIEMATGEGKTLTALMPLYLRSLEGKGALLATANDYLAARDAEFARPVFDVLGLSVGAVLDDATDDQRRAAYFCDVTYGTANQFGFDFLRDRAKVRFKLQHPAGEHEQPVGRGRLYSVLVDEADSLLIDEAATPLVISSGPPPLSDEKAEAFQWAAKYAPQATEGVHYQYNLIEKRVYLTPVGKQWVYNTIPHRLGGTLSTVDWHEYIERGIYVLRDQLPDRNYLIQDGGILLVEQATGRVGVGREWADGVQQAIQAKEGLAITMPNGHLARVTVQSLFLASEHLSGMTGTARSARGEFRSIYKLAIREIPTHRPCGRREMEALVCLSEDEWLEAIAEDCHTMCCAGRSVLIGARSISLSEKISAHLDSRSMEHQLLNARHDASEAQLVARAGEQGRITVATNMAGRGTDIDLSPEVRENGGLHVILAGVHESARVDRQLIGRAGRQGDPGSFRKILCLQDELLDTAFSQTEVTLIRERLIGGYSVRACMQTFDRAQAIITSRESAKRRSLFYSEKKNLKHLHRGGLDPLLDFPT